MASRVHAQVGSRWLPQGRSRRSTPRAAFSHSRECGSRQATPSLSQPVPIAVAYGDGIGPTIMEATLRILEAAKVPIAPERIEIGEKVYLSGVTSGIVQPWGGGWLSALPSPATWKGAS